MLRKTLMTAAAFAGASLSLSGVSSAQEGPLCPPAGEACPPLVAPSPFDVQPSEPSASADEDGPRPSPTLDDFPQSPNMLPQQPIQQQPFAAPAAGSQNMLTAATSPQSLAPNMIGDLFGQSGFSRLTIDEQTRSFAGYFRDSFQAKTQFSPSLDADNFINLTNSSPLSIVGDTTTTLPSDTIWMSQEPLPDSMGVPPEFPSAFALQENADETSATAGAFPDAVEVQFNSGRAEVDANDDHFYNIYTDYTIVDAYERTIVIPDPGSAPGAFIGRQKISENTSPLPRTRVFANYSHFSNTPLTPGGVNVNRVTPGFEYAFYDDDLSIEVRAPFATTLSSDLVSGGLTSTDEVEFGNLTAYFKALMWETDTFSWSLGIGVTAPTADDVTVREPGSATIARIENEAIHLLPFLGFLWTPQERLFVQGFLQGDFDTRGNPVEVSSFNNGVPTGNLSRIGRANDATYAFVDIGMGYWIYKNRCRDRFINGLAPTIELHYNAATDSADVIRHNNVVAGTRSDLEVTNLVLGLNAIVCDSGSLTLGYATPIAGDDQFDGELRVMFNWFLGL